MTSDRRFCDVWYSSNGKTGKKRSDPISLQTFCVFQRPRLNRNALTTASDE
jgi:hypothetical protein